MTNLLACTYLKIEKIKTQLIRDNEVEINENSV